MPKKSRFIVVVVIALLLSVTTYAFAASNTVPATSAGDGQGAVSGYTITNVKYTLAANPANLDKVEFDIAPVAGGSNPSSVSVQLSATGSWVACNVTTATHPVCTVTDTVASATLLHVVAAQ